MKQKSLMLIAIGLLYCCILTAQTTYVFVGTFNRDKQKEGIAVYTLDEKSGELLKVQSVTGILNPSFLAIGSDSNFLYACTESQTPQSGYINSFRFDKQTGRLTELNRQKTGGENPVYLTTSKDNRFLLSTNYTEAGLDVFLLNNNGTVGNRIQTIQYKEGSGATEGQDISHSHSVIFSPDQGYVLVPDLGADEIRSYRFNSSLAQPVSTESYRQNRAALGSGPRHICFHPNQKNVYCVEEIGGSLSYYQFHKGKLRLKQRVMLHNSSTGKHSSADVHISPDGKFLYASNRGDENNIAIFSIRPNGRLQLVDYQSTMGNHPRMFALSPQGQFLVVANQFSNNLRVFKRNERTGKLTPTGQDIPIESPSCVQIKTYH